VGGGRRRGFHIFIIDSGMNKTAPTNESNYRGGEKEREECGDTVFDGYDLKGNLEKTEWSWGKSQRGVQTTHQKKRKGPGSKDDPGVLLRGNKQRTHC